MKKIYTLAAVALAGATAVAAPVKFDRSTAEPVEGAMETVATNAVNLRALYEAGLTKDIVKRSWTDNSTGLTWTAYLGKTGQWCSSFKVSQDMPDYGLKEGDPYPFFLMPFYRVQSEFYTDGGSDDIMSLLWWPSKFLFQPDGTPEEDYDFDIVEINDPAITSLNFEEGAKGEYFFIGDDQPVAWLIQNGIQMNTPNMYGGVSMDTQQGNTLRINSYDAATTEFSCLYNGKLVPKEGAGNARTVKLNYVGEARVLGFETSDFTLDIKDVLIYNTGLWGAGDDALDADAEESQDYEPDWGPLRRYYFAFSQVPYDPATFDKDAIVMAPNFANMSADERTKIAFGYGAAYAPADATSPNGIYTLYDLPSEGVAAYAPKANSLIANGYKYDFCESDGLFVVRNGYYWWQEEKSQLGIGDENVGFNYAGADHYGNGYKLSFTGKIKFFNDPNDYSKYTEIEAKQAGVKAEAKFAAVEEITVDGAEAGEFAAKVAAANGQITVVADADAAVAVYTIAGQIVENTTVKAGETLTIDAAAGIYVVKVGNKAVKVAL